MFSICRNIRSTVDVPSMNTYSIAINKLADCAGWAQPPALWSRRHRNTDSLAVNHFAGGSLLAQHSCTRVWLIDWHTCLSITSNDTAFSTRLTLHRKSALLSRELWNTDSLSSNDFANSPCLTTGDCAWIGDLGTGGRNTLGMF